MSLDYSPGRARPYSAIRQGDYKVIRFYEDNRVELCNLKTDPEEKVELSVQETESLRNWERA